MSDAIAFLSRAIEQGQGLAKADVVLKGGRIFDLVSGELVKSDVAICNDRIVGTLGEYRGEREIDVSGKIVVPGFIDTHCHVESSLLTPLEFDRCVMSRGVTTSICDPHEIANVLGAPGLCYFLDAAMLTAMDLRVQLSSCVPATALETSGARLEAGDLLPLADHPKVLGLAEFMNFPGLLARDPSCLAKLAAFQTRPIDGHSPLLGGLALNGYLSAGVRTDHEVTNLPEAEEKLAKGMQLLIREGSVCKDLHALSPVITERNSPFIAFCTDDRNPLDIAEEGHLDFIIRTAIRLGAPPLGRAHLRPARSRPRRARLARRSRRHQRSRALRRLDRDDGRAGGGRSAVREAVFACSGRAQ
jgi:adenine deaminase